MKKYEEFLFESNFEGYTQVNDIETDKLIKNNCSEYNPGNFEITRYIGGDDLTKNDVNYLVNPMDRTRKSDNFHNTYTLLIDNFKSWKEFPKRSHALIATLNVKGKEDLKYKYVVHPYDDALWGVCPSYDIWFEWENLVEAFGSPRIYTLIRNLNNYNKKICGGLELNSDNYDILVSEINNLKKVIIDDADNFQKKKFADYISGIDKPLIEILEDLMNPYDNGFKLLTGNELFELPQKNYEIWTNDKVILKNKIYG